MGNRLSSYTKEQFNLICSLETTKEALFNGNNHERFQDMVAENVVKNTCTSLLVYRRKKGRLASNTSIESESKCLAPILPDEEIHIYNDRLNTKQRNSRRFAETKDQSVIRDKNEFFAITLDISNGKTVSSLCSDSIPEVKDWWMNQLCLDSGSETD